MLDPRADDQVIFNHALQGVRTVRATLGSIGRGYRAPATSEAVRAHLNAIAECWQARPVPDAITLSGAVARMVDPNWWARNLRRETVRENEATEHAQGKVKKRLQCYVTDHAVKRKRQRAKINTETLSRLEVVNGDGQAFNLAEVADGSVSNPKLRRAELMVRCRGFEETAAFMGHEAVFLTLTCPSRFHRFNAQGQPNEKWTGATPKDAQKYLNGVWARIRADWKRAGFTPYGFRVAEPHHDGCPHWHILLFAPADHVGWFVARRLVADRDDCGAGLVGIAGAHALADSPVEAGALKHRFTCKRIDPSQGSATGYIAKYICKNIDGLTEGGDGMGLDFASGTSADKAAPRVRAWASTWGIRQFQQIGGPSVTVWRELRKFKEDAGKPVQLDLFKNAIAAADRAAWFDYWMLQGGPESSRARLLKPHWVEDSEGKYGDAVKRVTGVQDGDGIEQLTTRLHTWTVQREGMAAVAEFTAANERRFKAFGTRDPDFMDFLTPQGEAAQPWTGVNNCTDDDEAEALRADYLRGSGGFSLGNSHESINVGSFEPGRPVHLRGQERDSRTL